MTQRRDPYMGDLSLAAKLEFDLYKAREVAELLRMNTKTLYNWVNSGRVRAIRTPSQGIRISRDEVLRLLDLRTVDAGDEGVDKQLPHQ